MGDKSEPQQEARSAGDLGEKRVEFLETFFRKGVEFATDLINEVQELRGRVAELGEENMELKSPSAKLERVSMFLTFKIHLALMVCTTWKKNTV